jgi:hypothetical protein
MKIWEEIMPNTRQNITGMVARVWGIPSGTSRHQFVHLRESIADAFDFKDLGLEKGYTVPVFFVPVMECDLRPQESIFIELLGSFGNSDFSIVRNALKSRLRDAVMESFPHIEVEFMPEPK